MIKKLFMLTLLLSCFTVMAKSPDLSQMTDQEKQRTGLNKLSADELNALDQWLKNKQITIDQKTSQRDLGFVKSQKKIERREIKARLEKQYNDKVGNTYYNLDNGQVWKRVSSGSIFLKSDGPQIVTIKPAILGSWTIKGDGNRGTKVKRIK